MGRSIVTVLGDQPETMPPHGIASHPHAKERSPRTRTRRKDCLAPAREGKIEQKFMWWTNVHRGSQALAARTPTPPPLPSPLYSKPPHPPHQISDVKIGSLLPMAQLSPFMAFTTPHALLLILVRAICPCSRYLSALFVCATKVTVASVASTSNPYF